jgi:hypothetical protein
MVSPLSPGLRCRRNLLKGDILTGHNMTALTAAKSWRPGIATSVLALAIMFFSQCALADEGGVSFWIPGFFGSLAAAPQQEGWSLTKADSDYIEA